MGDNLIEMVGKPEFGGKLDKSFKMPSWGWVVATIWFVGSITGAFWLSFHTENVKSEARAMAERIAKDW